MAQLIESVWTESHGVLKGDQTAETTPGPASQSADRKAVPAQERRAGWSGAWRRFLDALLQAFSSPAA
jgi:hypothetical protein